MNFNFVIGMLDWRTYALGIGDLLGENRLLSEGNKKTTMQMCWLVDKSFGLVELRLI